MMEKGFKLLCPDSTEIRFEFYLEEAPQTCAVFMNMLPFSKTFMHARVSGQEIWFDQLAGCHFPQENASVFTLPGEVVIGPENPSRVKTASCFGIYYGEGKGLDACNIFARVYEEDMPGLVTLGNHIWRNGACELHLSLL
jgi:hypothetical protein